MPSNERNMNAIRFTETEIEHPEYIMQVRTPED